MSEFLPEKSHVGNFLREGHLKKGWFIGSFLQEGLNHNSNVEVAVKTLRPGDKEAAHFHKDSTEFCMVIKGNWIVTIDGIAQTLKAGQYVASGPGSVLEWEMLPESKPVRVVVVRTPSVNDKEYVQKDQT